MSSTVLIVDHFIRVFSERSIFFSTVTHTFKKSLLYVSCCRSKQYNAHKWMIQDYWVDDEFLPVSNEMLWGSIPLCAGILTFFFIYVFFFFCILLYELYSVYFWFYLYLFHSTIRTVSSQTGSLIPSLFYTMFFRRFSMTASFAL